MILNAQDAPGLTNVTSLTVMSYRGPTCRNDAGLSCYSGGRPMGVGAWPTGSDRTDRPPTSHHASRFLLHTLTPASIVVQLTSARAAMAGTYWMATTSDGSPTLRFPRSAFQMCRSFWEHRQWIRAGRSFRGKSAGDNKNGRSDPGTGEAVLF